MILLKLILAHLVGDFVLQAGSWVRDKQRRKIASPYLYAHIAVHAILMLVLLPEFRWLPMIGIIALTHYLIDLLKLYQQNDKNLLFWYVADQLLHLLVIFSVWYFYTAVEPDWENWPVRQLLIVLIALISLGKPTAYLIQAIMYKWSAELETGPQKSLNNAGKYIGILERLFILIFILLGQWDGIGYLLAAKSIFRFGDLREARDRKLTEYILIGTLLSFAIAIAIGLLAQYAISTGG